jgi:antitoxin component HigA of HigAB toxin-antitoxin module
MLPPAKTPLQSHGQGVHHPPQATPRQSLSWWPIHRLRCYHAHSWRSREEKHHDIPWPDPVAAILYTMESRGLSRRDLEQYIGSRARVSEILSRKRPLSIEMIRKLHAGLGIPAEVLIQPYPLEKSAA